jgi:hypothetical protein
MLIRASQLFGIDWLRDGVLVGKDTIVAASVDEAISLARKHEAGVTAARRRGDARIAFVYLMRAGRFLGLSISPASRAMTAELADCGDKRSRPSSAHDDPLTANACGRAVVFNAPIEPMTPGEYA